MLRHYTRRYFSVEKSAKTLNPLILLPNNPNNINNIILHLNHIMLTNVKLCGLFSFLGK